MHSDDFTADAADATEYLKIRKGGYTKREKEEKERRTVAHQTIDEQAWIFDETMQQLYSHKQ